MSLAKFGFGGARLAEREHALPKRLVTAARYGNSRSWELLMISTAVSIAWRASTPTCAFAPDNGNNTPMTTSCLAWALAGPPTPGSFAKDRSDAPLNCL